MYLGNRIVFNRKTVGVLEEVCVVGSKEFREFKVRFHLPKRKIKVKKKKRDQRALDPD